MMKGAEIIMSKRNEMDNTLKFQEKENSRMQSELFLSKALRSETIQSKMKKIRYQNGNGINFIKKKNLYITKIYH